MPHGVRAIAVINGLAAVVTIGFWGLVARRIFGPAGLPAGLDASSAASTLGFMIADVVWAVPLLVVSVPGLWRTTPWGWTAAQMANVLWLYSLTATWARDLRVGRITPGDVVFLPFTLFAAWAAVHLWSRRHEFWPAERLPAVSGRRRMAGEGDG